MFGQLYFGGPLPFADKISKRKGVDIFQIGTGLAGASNVLKSVGKGSALIVLVFDIAKGALAVSASGLWELMESLSWSFIFCNIWSLEFCFYRFKGGMAWPLWGDLRFPLFGATAILAMLAAGYFPFACPKTSFFLTDEIAAGYLTIVGICVYRGDKVETAVWFGEFV
ncbi:MAG: hypothetical protein CM1200mP3_10720 [Chloroflexota bacterium]|nr:MAG: hypothetical protein CM1200mP3_10720 [Chloroflexota bacterium]